MANFKEVFEAKHIKMSDEYKELMNEADTLFNKYLSTLRRYIINKINSSSFRYCTCIDFDPPSIIIDELIAAGFHVTHTINGFGELKYINISWDIHRSQTGYKNFKYLADNKIYPEVLVDLEKRIIKQINKDDVADLQQRHFLSEETIQRYQKESEM